MKKGWILGVVLIMNQASAALLDTQACDALYANRGTDSLSSVDCYQSLLTDQKDQSIQKQIYQKMFIALSAVINDLPKTDSEVTGIQKALNLIDSFKNDFGSSADYFYWKACFTSFDAIQKDRGALIPTHMFRVLGNLQDLLQTSIKIDPSVHFYGAMRVLGMMHTQMPRIVGGDKMLAEKMLREAYSKAPVFSMNHLAFAKILDANGKSDEAIKVLTNLLASDNSSFNPYPDQPLLSLLPETLKDKAEAQKLLDSIRE